MPIDEFKKIYDAVYSSVDASEHVIDSTKLSTNKTLETLKTQLEL